MLHLDGLGKDFGAVTALEAVTLEIPHGEFVCLLGPSGCGKTTLLRLIAGLEPPSRGRLTLDGADLTETPAHRRNFGMVFQSLALFPHRSVGENIAYGLKIRGAPRAERRAATERLLDLVQLPGLGDRPVSALSGGQRQRVAIARALALEPKLFLLDEPLSALDANLREALQVELRLLQQRLGITTILVTHDQREAMTMADRIVVMDRGVVAQVGPPIEVYRNPASRFVAEFVGQSNLIPARWEEGGLRVLDRLIPMAPAGQGAALLAIRPEDLRLQTAPGPETLPATVAFVRDLGAVVETHLDCGSQRVLAVEPRRGAEPHRTGETLHLAFDPCAATVLAP